MTQSISLKDQLKALEQIQETDLKIDQLISKKTALPIQLKALENSLALLKKNLDQKQFDVREGDKALKQIRAAIQLNQERLERTTSRIEGAANAKEFGASNKEVEQLKKLNDELEAQKAKIESDIATAQKACETVTAQHEELQKKWESESAAVGAQISALDKDIAQLTTGRNTFVPTVRADVLSRYDRVRKVKAGMGIAPAIGGRCKGCNMTLAPQMFNEIHKGSEIHSCPTCHRILFLPG